MKKYFSMLAIILVSIMLSACGALYNNDEEKRVQHTPDLDSLSSIQRAIDAYQQDTGVLPIKNSEANTDIFVKYQIDFSKLTNGGYIAKSPDNSFEQGGIFQYVIWDAEENPAVKLIDLRMTERLREVNLRFMSTQYPQFKERIADYVYTINYDNIGYETDVAVESPYSSNLLPLVISTEGVVYVDYSIELQQFIKEKGLTPTPGEDIRYLIADESPILPAYSLPYTVDENNDVIFMYDPVKAKEEKQQEEK
ncbi:MAG: lipoprotein [Lysinibacillus sp.]